MSEADMKRLSEMRVVELRAELEKRGLDRSGNKQTLLERLQKYFNEHASSESAEKAEEQEDDKEAEEPKQTNQTSEHKPDDAVTTANDDKQDAQPQVKETSETREDDSKDTNKSDGKDSAADGESVIRLTLEEEEAAFHDDENEPQETEKSVPENNPSDTKSTGNNIEAHSSKVDRDVSAQPPQDQPKGDKATRERSSSDGKTASKVKKSSQSQNRNLWITNISKSTRATELKQALSAYGKVIGAKVVINARFPGTCCYGYVTMDTVADADNCIAKLNNTELNGQIIKIEKVRPDHMNPLKLQQQQQQRKHSETRDNKDRSRDRKSVDKKKDDKPLKEEPVVDKKPDEKSESGAENGHKSRSEKRSPSRERSRTSEIRPRHERSLSAKSKREQRERREREILTFDKIKEERERQRVREQERIMREEARRRREEATRQREIERRQRSEAQRLEREREKLRQEREKIEREKEQLIRLERERQKLEREKLELEKLELQRAKLRLQEEDRRAVKRTAPYRREETYEDRKRSATERHFDEAPPPPRFDPPASLKSIEPAPPKKFPMSTKDMKSRFSFEKRESYVSSKRDRDYDTERPSSLTRPPPTSIAKYENANVFNLGRERDTRTEMRGRDDPSSSGIRLAKESRYERDRSPHYRPVREDRDRRSIPEKARDHRYSDGPKESGRFDRNSTSNNSWGHSSTPSKVFSTGNTGTANKTWVKDSWRPNDVSTGSSDRWGGPNSRGGSGISGPTFSGSPNMNVGPTCPPPPGLNNYPTDRFDYKSMGSNMRKY